MEYVRKTKDVYYLMGNYGYGWEEMFECENWKDAREQLKTYRDNEPQYSHKIVKRRVKIWN